MESTFASTSRQGLVSTIRALIPPFAHDHLVAGGSLEIRVLKLQLPITPVNTCVSSHCHSIVARTGSEEHVLCGKTLSLFSTETLTIWCPTTSNGSLTNAPNPGIVMGPDSSSNATGAACWASVVTSTLPSPSIGRFPTSTVPATLCVSGKLTTSTGLTPGGSTTGSCAPTARGSSRIAGACQRL